MVRTAVTSSNLASIGYDAGPQILQVEFKTGRVYNYYRVPPEKFDAIMKAESCGKYLNSEIKPNHDFDEIDLNSASHALTHQRQLDMDGVEVGVSRQALDEAGRELHFLRFFYQVFSQSVNKSDEPIEETYEDRFGWPAPAQYRAPAE